MTANKTSLLQEVLSKFETEILQDWMKEQLSALSLRLDLISEVDLRRESTEFLGLLSKGVESGQLTDITAPAWEASLAFLAGTSRSRASRGFRPSEIATFVFSLKQPIFSRIQKEAGSDLSGAVAETWVASALIDKLGLYTTEAFMKSREEIIKRQQVEMLELSTPVVKLWDGILALPLIGTLDSARTQVVMESLLQAIVESGSQLAIIDITGVPAVDTLVAQHLLKTVAAARLMGAQCLISGIRPQIAQTMIHLGVAFGDIVTKSTLADALAHAFKQSGLQIVRKQNPV